ncbi:MAG TPA: transcription antitermination factor NusB, partial [Phycisphaerales bacterium]|nr:transcription antitermination factor NusB [Phycisphaerales bacterium]
RFPDLDLLQLRTAHLDPRDAALAHAIYDAVIRRWITLEFLLARHLSQPIGGLEPRLRAALLVGAAQVLFLDRLPAHAVLNQAVQWAKQRIRPGAGNLVNAVLRRIVELRAAAGTDSRPTYTGDRDELPRSDGTAVVLAGPVLPEAEEDRLAIATSHPRALIDAWSLALGPAAARRLALHSLARPPNILNTAHARGPLPDALLTPHSIPGHHVFTGSHAELVSLLASRPDVWVQDPASSLAVRSVSGREPALVLDMCAGQGTKTRQLAATFPRARIVATDQDPGRFETLQRVFATEPRVRVLPLPELREHILEQADLILLDVPCSNTAVLARRPEARYRFDTAHLDGLAEIQRQIIADSIPYLSVGPRRIGILYSTCSLHPSENDAQAAWAARWHRLTPRGPRLHLPQGGPGEPDHQYTDGSFSVLLA